MNLSFFVSGTPIPKGSTRSFVINGRAVTTNANRNTKDWQLRIAHEAQANIGDWPPNYGGAVIINCSFLMPRPKTLKKSIIHHTKRPDLDKLQRAVLDGITGILIKDDSQVIQITARKYYADDPEPTGLYIEISSIGFEQVLNTHHRISIVIGRP